MRTLPLNNDLQVDDSRVDDSRVDDSQVILCKFNNPTRFDFAPEGTVIKSFNVGDEYKYYIQISCYEDEPNWVTWDYFLGLIFKKKALDEKFVKKCLNVFNAEININELNF